jgi:hypothetical protein
MIAFDMQRMNQLQISRGDGVKPIPVTDPRQPFTEHWWSKGHPLGWAESFTREIDHLLQAVAGEGGYLCAEACDPILRSAARGQREPITYRGLTPKHEVPGSSSTACHEPDSEGRAEGGAR